jgi:PAS domain S-box-containing protein
VLLAAGAAPPTPEVRLMESEPFLTLAAHLEEERRYRVMAERLLRDLHLLTEADEPAQVFGKLLEVLAGLTSFEAGVVLVRGAGNHGVPIAATHERLRGYRWGAAAEQPEGGPVVQVVPDVADSELWRGQDPQVVALAGSALHLFLSGAGRPLHAICVHRDVGHFGDAERQALERFAPVLSHALGLFVSRDERRQKEQLRQSQRVALDRISMMERAVGLVGVALCIRDRSGAVVGGDRRFYDLVRPYGGPVAWFAAVDQLAQEPAHPICEQCGRRHRYDRRMIELAHPGLPRRQFEVIWAGHLHTGTSDPFAELVLIADVTRLQNDRERLADLARCVSDNPQPVLTLDERGAVVHGNRSGRESIAGRLDHDGGPVAQAILQAIGEALRTQTVQQVIDQDTASAAIWDIVPAPGRREVHAYGRDLTHLRVAERSAQHANARLVAILEGLQSGVLIAGEDDRIISVNAAFCELFGIDADPAGLVGSRASSLHESIRARLVEAQGDDGLPSDLSRATRQAMSIQVGLRDGRVLEWRSVPIQLDETYSGYQWRFRDVTDRHREQQALTASREVIDEVVQLNPHAIWLTTRAGKLLTFNSAFTRLAMVRPGLRLRPGLPSEQIFGDGSREFVEGLIRDAGRGVPVSRRVDLDAKDGGVHIEVRVTPLEASGEEAALVFFAEDQTHRYREAAALRRDRDVLDALARAHSGHIRDLQDGAVYDDLLGDLLRLTDSDAGVLAQLGIDGVISVVSAAGGRGADEPAARCGFPRDAREWLPLPLVTEVVAKSAPVVGRCCEVVSPGGRPLPGCQGGAVIGLPLINGSRLVGVLCMRTPGRPYDAATTSFVQPLLTACGAFLDARRAAEERARAEHEVQVAREQAELASRAKGEFLASISHEIRGPLHAIVGLIDLLTGTTVSALQADYLGRLRSNSESLLSLISDVLDFSKIEAGVFALDPIPMDPRDLVEDVSALLSARAFTKGVRLYTFIDADMPERVVADPHRLRQVLYNLIGNAVRYTNEGEIVVSCQTRPHSQPGFVWLDLEVRDTGIGINSHDLERIFDKFVQGERASSAVYGGTGLGLSITRSLVSLMGGEVRVSSVPHKGSSFRVELPVEMVQGSEGALARLRRAGQGLRVLAIVPDETGRDNIGALLGPLGVAVETVATADAAVGRLRASLERIDVVLVADNLEGDSVRRVAAEASRMSRAGRRTGLVSLVRGSNTGLSSTDVAILTWPVRRESAISTLVAAAGRTVGEPRKKRLGAAAPERKRVLDVLVAEDSADNQLVIRGWLEAAGHKVRVVANGQAAVDEVVSRPYDAVVLDIHMPLLDGIEVARRIRAHELRADRNPAGVIALTGHATDDIRQQCIDAGVDEFMTKPLAREELLRRVTRVVGSRPVVLVVDDAPDSRRLIVHVLRRDGSFRIIEAGNGQEALNRFRADVDLVLMDMEMPVMDGFDAVRALRSRPDGRGVPIVAITGHSSADVRRGCLAAGCSGYLVKPVRAPELMALVHNFVQPVVSDGDGGTTQSEEPGAPPPSERMAEVQAQVASLEDRLAAAAVRIDPDLVELLPAYIADRNADLQVIDRALGEDDFRRIWRVGHSMMGTASAYGFERLNELGRDLRDAAQSLDRAGVLRAGRMMREYLAEVEPLITDLVEG